MEKNNSMIAKFVTAFVAIIIGVALITQIAVSTQGATTASVYVTNEAVNIAAARVQSGNSVDANQTFSLAQAGPTYTPRVLASSITVTNSSGTVLSSGNWTYTASNNTLQFKNTSDTVTGPDLIGNNTLVTYQAYPAGYLTQGWDATVVNLIPGFFAIALMGIGLWLFYSMGQDLGFY